MVGGGGGSLSKSGGCENFMLQVDFFFNLWCIFWGDANCMCMQNKIDTALKS